MRSFRHAWDGLVYAVKTERHMRVHFAAVFYIVLAGLFLDFDHAEWGLTALACGLVTGAELINTALERLCDGLEPGHSPVVKIVKDLAAGAVLVCAAAALCIGVFLLWGRSFWPPSFEHYTGAAALPFWVWFIWIWRRKDNGKPV